MTLLDRPESATQGPVDRALLSRCELPLATSRFASRPGSAPSKRPGLGWDVNSSREYSYGDDPRKVDWNATARTGSLQVRTNLADVAVSVQFFPLLSVSMLIGPNRTKHVAATNAMAFLAALAASRGHRSSLFLDPARKVLLPARSPEIALDRLLSVEELRRSASEPFAAFTVLPAPTTPSLAVVVADLASLRLLDRSLFERAGGRDICVLFVYDPAELLPPPIGSVRLAGFSGGSASYHLSESTARSYGDLVRSRVSGAAATVSAAGGVFLPVSTSSDTQEQMVLLLDKRKGSGGVVSLP